MRVCINIISCCERSNLRVILICKKWLDWRFTSISCLSAFVRFWWLRKYFWWWSICAVTKVLLNYNTTMVYIQWLFFIFLNWRSRRFADVLVLLSVLRGLLFLLKGSNLFCNSLMISWSKFIEISRIDNFWSLWALVTNTWFSRREIL